MGAKASGAQNEYRRRRPWGRDRSADAEEERLRRSSPRMVA